MTCAKDGNLENQITKHFEKYGRSPVTIANPTLIKSDRTLLKEYHPDALDVPKAVKSELELIRTAIEEKTKNTNYQGKYILLVLYSPSLPGRFEEVNQQLPIDLPNSIFEKIYLIDPWKNNFVQLN